MKRLVKIILIIIGVVVFLLVLATLVFSGFLPYSLIVFSGLCTKQCSESGYTHSQCVNFQGFHPANENQCGDGGVDVGMASDCRTRGGKIGGGSKQCCCYNK